MGTGGVEKHRFVLFIEFDVDQRESSKLLRRNNR
jgi:hypothetical protein